MAQETPREDLLKMIEGNKYVTGITNDGKLKYTNKFYRDLLKKLEENLTYEKAYEALGFPIEKFGRDRATSACKRAKEMEAKNIRMIKDPKNFVGSKSREEMGELTEDEELAYYKARVLYLEEVNELQKKTSVVRLGGETYILTKR